MVGSAVVEPADAPSSEPIATDADPVRLVCAPLPEKARDAEAELYKRLAPRVRLYGLRHLRSEAAAADLVQQVLVIVLQTLRAGRLREPERLVSFVLGTCRTVVRDLKRGVERRRQVLERFAADLSAAGARAPRASELDTERLAGCLGRLAERERTVVVLTFYGERSTDEIAAELGLSAANVRVIRHRALERLRNCMSGEEALS